jgi:hypothetical protein
MFRLFGQTLYSELAANPTLLWVYSLGGIAFCLAVLAVVHFLPRQAKRYMIIVLTFLAGAVYALEFFWPVPPGEDQNPLSTYTNVIGDVLQVVAGFTFLLGIYNLVHVHGNNVRRRRPNWTFSLVFFAFFAIMVVASFWRDWYRWFGPQEQAMLTLGHLPPEFILDRNTIDDPELRAQLGLGPIPEGFNRRFANDLYTYLFQGLYLNLEATMFSILAFYIVSAAYRAFRVRSAEAALMMITAVILMAGQVPLGMALTNWVPADGPFALARIENFAYWVLSVVNMPVQRAIDFGLGLGMLAMSLRIWLSLERGTYFGQEV